MKDKFILVNKAYKRLSGFYPNDIKKYWLKYRDNDFVSFGTLQEAKDYLKHINSYGVGKSLSIEAL